LLLENLISLAGAMLRFPGADNPFSPQFSQFSPRFSTQFSTRYCCLYMHNSNGLLGPGWDPMRMVMKMMTMMRMMMGHAYLMESSRDDLRPNQLWASFGSGPRHFYLFKPGQAGSTPFLLKQQSI